jgi:hypothetical protein
MNHPDDDGQPTFAPENTRELDVGEKIENGDLKWHQSGSGSRGQSRLFTLKWMAPAG